MFYLSTEKLIRSPLLIFTQIIDWCKSKRVLFTSWQQMQKPMEEHPGWYRRQSCRPYPKLYRNRRGRGRGEVPLARLEVDKSPEGRERELPIIKVVMSDMKIGSPYWDRKDREHPQNKRCFGSCLGIFPNVPIPGETNQRQSTSIIIANNPEKFWLWGRIPHVQQEKPGFNRRRNNERELAFPLLRECFLSQPGFY